MVRGVFLVIAAGLLIVGLAAAGHVVGTLVIPAAIAQTETVVLQPVSVAGTIWTQLQPAVLTAVSAVMGALAIWVGTKLATLLGVKNQETKDKIAEGIRTLIHAVAWNAMKYAAAKSDNAILDKLAQDMPPPPNLIETAMGYFKDMSPELAETITDSELEKVLTSKLPELINLVKPNTQTVLNTSPSK